MTYMNKEVPNPVYSYMNSNTDKRIAEMHTKGFEMVFDSIVGKQISFEEIRKRKRDNFKTIVVDTLAFKIPDLTDTTFGDIAEEICKETIDKSVVN